MKKTIYLSLALALGLAGCGGDKGSSRAENVLASSGFEEIEGWNGDAPLPLSLTREKAHSGTYSMRVGPDVEYASGFIGALGKMSPVRLNEVKVTAWIYLDGTAPSGAIVTQVLDPATPNAKPLLWESLPLDKAVPKRKEWVQVEKTVRLPANVSPTCKLYVYLWRGAAPVVAYIDDVQLERSK